MMKTNYLFIGMAALMIAACSNNENEPQVDDGRIAVSLPEKSRFPAPRPTHGRQTTVSVSICWNTE